MKRTLYQRIVQAAKRGHGVRLSPDETWRLAQDDAIAEAARCDDELYDDEMSSAEEASDEVTDEGRATT